MRTEHGQPGVTDALLPDDVFEACGHLRMALRRYTTAEQRHGMATMLCNSAEHAQVSGRTGTELVLMALYAAMESTQSQPGPKA